METTPDFARISSPSDEEAAEIQEAAPKDVQPNLNKIVSHSIDGQGQGNDCLSPALEAAADTQTSTGSNRPQPFIESRFGGEVWTKIRRRVELVPLAVLIVVIWGLLSLPTVFYHLPNEKVIVHLLILFIIG